MQNRRRLGHIAVILIFLAITVFINLIFIRLDIVAAVNSVCSSGRIYQLYSVI